MSKAINGFLVAVVRRVLTLAVLAIILGCAIAVGVCDGRGDDPGTRYAPQRGR